MSLWVIPIFGAILSASPRHIHPCFFSAQPLSLPCLFKSHSRFLQPPASRRPGDPAACASPPTWQKKTLASSRHPRHQRRLHQRRGRERMFARKWRKLLETASHPLSTLFGVPVGPVPRLRHPQASRSKEEKTGMMRSTTCSAMTATRRCV